MYAIICPVMSYANIIWSSGWHDKELLSGLEINFFVWEPAGDQRKNFGRQIVNFGRRLILYVSYTRTRYVTLHARKVTIEERKQLETTRVTLSYKATVVLR